MSRMFTKLFSKMVEVWVINDSDLAGWLIFHSEHWGYEMSDWHLQCLKEMAARPSCLWKKRVLFVLPDCTYALHLKSEDDMCRMLSDFSVSRVMNG